MPSRVERLLQILGFAVWAFIGFPTLWQMAQHSPAPRELAWLGGGLDVSSVPGRGFAVRVMLPLAGDPA